MKFYDREQEMAFLKETREQAKKVARFTVVTGRRRIGKTTLVREAYNDKPFVYFFVARKAESDGQRLHDKAHHQPQFDFPERG